MLRIPVKRTLSEGAAQSYLVRWDFEREKLDSFFWCMGFEISDSYELLLQGAQNSLAGLGRAGGTDAGSNIGGPNASVYGLEYCKFNGLCLGLECQ